MNHTKSGIIACGAPGSRVRYQGECEEGLKNPVSLLLTDEGNALANRFFRAVGCDPDTMPEEVKAATLKQHEHAALFHFLAGASFTLTLP